jgi:drug/metabolite transporter (DMT)-like permease
MELWALVTIAAAAVQTVRFMLQKHLKTTGLSTGGATYARFLFAAPIAAAALAGLAAVQGNPLPGLPLAFWAWIMAGGVAQIVATFATVALFSRKSFAVGIAFTKTEALLVAGLSALLLSEPVSSFGLLAIIIGTCGVLLLSRPPGGWMQGGTNYQALAFGLLAGGLFGASAIGYRAATMEVEHPQALFRALVALVAATGFQTLVMTIWLYVGEPGQLRIVAARWRTVLPVGVTGVLGSLGWFTAFALQNAAYVRSLGQVELLFSILASVIIFRERLRIIDVVGMFFLAVSVVMIVSTL